METTNEISKKEVENQINDLFKLLLKKTGLSKKDVIEHATREFIANNINMVTSVERKKFRQLVF
jgi:hypothetical protein